MKKLFLVGGLAAILVTSLILGGCAKPAPREGWPSSISFATGPSGSGAYARTAGLAVMLDKYLGVTTAPESIPAPEGQIKAMAAGKVEFAWPFASTSRDAYFGAESFQGEPVDVRVVIGGAGSAFFIFTDSDSGIVNFEDIRGKKVMCIGPGRTWVEGTFECLLEAHGMTMDDITPLKWTSQSALMEALDSGETDVGTVGTSPTGPSPAFREREVKKPLRWVHIERGTLEGVAEKIGPQVTVQMYPGGKFKLYPEDFPVLISYMAIIALPDLPESFVYSLLKMCWDDHPDEYLAIGRGIQIYNLEDTIKAGAIIPFHPGAVKYIKEKGLWTKELEARQEKLLKEFGAPRK